jgi:bifunctional non-homologous end joining protein LigD
VVDQRVEVAGRTLTVSNLDKVLYPATGTTKADLLRYASAVADVWLPHLAGRPATLKRWPDGVDGESFFQKRCPKHRPDHVTTITMARSSRDDEAIEHCHLGDLAALVWAVNLAALELHVPMGQLPDPERPTAVVFDLDPGAPADVVDCAWLALELRALFDALGLDVVAKTSGGKGMQLHVPVDPEVTDVAAARDFARAVAEALAERHPDRVVTTQKRSERPGKVLIDWTQNHPRKTTISVYSPRGRERPTVSTPLTWAEVAAAHEADDPAQLRFELDDVRSRVAEQGDLFARALTLDQTLPGATATGRRRRTTMGTKDHGPSIKDDETYEALRDEGHSKEAAARIANSGTAGSKKGGAQPPYDEWTVDELRERAAELDVEGRSSMNKSELIEALRDR